MLSTLPGTSNSRASRTGFPVWLTSSATRSSACSAASFASLKSTADRSTGVAVAQVPSAARADATAVSTSPGDASAYSATASPVAGFKTRCRPPPVTIEAPSIQLPATVDTEWEETTVMGQR